MFTHRQRETAGPALAREHAVAYAPAVHGALRLACVVGEGPARCVRPRREEAGRPRPPARPAPQTASALAEGRIGTGQAAEIARAAQRGRIGLGDDVEGLLLEPARSESPEQLRRRVRLAEQEADADTLLRDENSPTTGATAR